MMALREARVTRRPEVILAPDEMRFACRVGMARAHAQRGHQGYCAHEWSEDPDEKDVVGALAEMAFARYYGLPRPRVDPTGVQKADREHDFTVRLRPADVTVDVEVKGTSNPSRNLLVPTGYPVDAALFVSVYVDPDDYQRTVLQGFYPGSELAAREVDEWLPEPGYRVLYRGLCPMPRPEEVQPAELDTMVVSYAE